MNTTVLAIICSLSFLLTFGVAMLMWLALGDRQWGRAAVWAVVLTAVVSVFVTGAW